MSVALPVFHQRADSPVPRQRRADHTYVHYLVTVKLQNKFKPKNFGCFFFPEVQDMVLGSVFHNLGNLCKMFALKQLCRVTCSCLRLHFGVVTVPEKMIGGGGGGFACEPDCCISIEVVWQC